MTSRLAAVPRNSGRWLLTMANVITTVVPLAADWNAPALTTCRTALRDSPAHRPTYYRQSSPHLTALAGWLLDRQLRPGSAGGRR